MVNDKVLIKSANVIAVLENQDTGERRYFKTHNAVCTTGARYYAQRSCGESATNNFVGTNAGLRLGSGTDTPTVSDTDVKTFISGTGLAVSANYPCTNDSDGNNTGSGTGVQTWKYYYAAGTGTADGIAEGAVVDHRTTPTAALCHFKFSAAFNKGANDTLTVFVNHTFANA